MSGKSKGYVRPSKYQIRLLVFSQLDVTEDPPETLEDGNYSEPLEEENIDWGEVWDFVRALNDEQLQAELRRLPDRWDPGDYDDHTGLPLGEYFTVLDAVEFQRQIQRGIAI